MRVIRPLCPSQVCLHDFRCLPIGKWILNKPLGTSITVYGTIPKAQTNISSISQYSIDRGSLEGTFIYPPSANIQFQQRFFVSPELPYGFHHLHILDTITSDGLWLDFFVVTTGLVSNTSSTPLSVSDNPSISTITPNQNTSTPLPPGFTQAPPTGNTSSKSHLESWVIAVSLAIGGCALITALTLNIYSFRRMRRIRHESGTARTLEPFSGKPLIAF